LIVDGSGSGYVKTVCDYVHLNPARARLLKPAQALRDYRWSSWPEYLKRAGQRWPWLSVGRVLGEYRIPRDSAAGRRQLEIALEERRVTESGADYKLVRRGWCLGADLFRQELLGQMQDRMGAEHYGVERQETTAVRAERIVAEEMKRRRWEEAELERRAKGDGQKVAIAMRLRAETAVTVQWIAQRLQMGAPGYVHHLLYRQRKVKGE
jgi:hypothetical protein